MTKATIRKTAGEQWELVSETGNNLITLDDLEAVKRFAEEQDYEYTVEEEETTA